MLTLPEHWAPSCSREPHLPLLGLPGRSMEFRDPIVLAEQLGTLLPLRSCDPAQRASASAPFHCHTGALVLGDLEIVALWGTGLRGEIDGTDLASFILPYRGEGHFRIDGRSLSNRSGRTLLLVPPGPWRTRNDVMGGVTIRVHPQRLQDVGRTMAGPTLQAEHWLGLARTPLVLSVEALGHALRFERLYRVMTFLHGLLLRLGSVPEALRLDDLLVRQMVEVLAPGLLAAAAAGPAAEPRDELEELIDWIHAHSHQPISLTDLERRSHDSRRSLQVAFQARFGCGPMQYLRRQRLWRARRQLEEARPGTTVSAIAFTCGYLSLASFRRDFQTRFGLPPSSLLAGVGVADTGVGGAWGGGVAALRKRRPVDRGAGRL